MFHDFFGHEELENFPLKYIRCFHVHLDMPLQGPLPMLLAQLLLLCTCWQRAAPILVWIAGILERSPARCLPSCYVLNVLCMIVHPLSLKYLLCAPTWIHMGYSLNVYKKLLYPRAVNIWAVMYFRFHYKAESCIYAMKTLSCKLALDLRWFGARYFYIAI